MLTIRKAAERGHANHGWLDTYHTFSFDTYYDPAHMGFRSLRVINEDRVAAGRGFGMHPHRDMEIITVVLEGELAHRDSMGNSSVIRPGEVQRMSAGTGITHSEENPSKTESVHLLQIWIQPSARGGPPSYEQKMFPIDDRRGRLQLLASPDGRDGSITIQQDAQLYGSKLEPGAKLSHNIEPSRHIWIQMISGDLEVNDESLHAGDGASISNESALKITAQSPAEFLLFDLA